MIKLLLLLLPVACFGQTRMPIGQLRFGASDAVKQIRLLGFGLEATQVHIGPGLKMVLLEGVPTLVAAPPKVVRKRLTLAQDPSGNYSTPPDAEIFRNGLLMTEDVDYIISDGVLLPKAYPGPDGKLVRWAKDDLVRAHYFEVEPAPTEKSSLDQ
jgi:hypothetical protein